MDENKKKSKIDSVNDVLYSRSSDGVFVKKRHILSNKDTATDTAPSAWSSQPETPESQKSIPYTKILMGAFIFFILAMGFAFYQFFAGSNIVSGDNINILVSGPISVSGGEEFPLDIEIRNDNKIDLKSVSLQIEYPDGTRSPEDVSVELRRQNETIGDILVGQSSRYLTKAVLYGEEKTEKTITVSIEYRVSGSNAIFHKEKEYNVLISSSPVNIQVNSPGEVNANQQIDFLVDVKSNSLTSLKGLLLKVDYPFGFNLTSANPRPISTNESVFSIGDLEPGASRLIRISGILAGQDGEERILKFTVGTPSKENTQDVGTPFAVYISAVSIKKSSIGLIATVNGSSNKEVAVDVGGDIQTHIDWRNNLAERIHNLVVQIKLSGPTLDKTTVRVEDGFYNSSQNTIVFDRGPNPNFIVVNPNDEGSLSFDFSTLLPSSNSLTAFANSQIGMDIMVLGTRAESGGQETLYADSKVIKISSQLKLLARGFRTVGPFENSGPFPPKADQQTTYTITWTATNSFNNISGARVSAILPQNVVWTGFTSPDTENITYDSSSGQIVWNVGDMRSGTGITYPSKDLSFQVAVTPSITQIGSVVTLLNESTISGTDTYSLSGIGETKSSVTTNITSDPQYIENIGRVVQ
jgi:hypothetical protein